MGLFLEHGRTRESVSFLVHIKEALENPTEILMNNKIEKALELG